MTRKVKIHTIISIEFKQNLRNSYIVVWEFCDKNIQNSIKTNVEYESKIQYNPIKLLKSINILMHKTERSKYPFASITQLYYFRLPKISETS